jgi:hypothetical protein
MEKDLKDFFVARGFSEAEIEQVAKVQRQAHKHQGELSSGEFAKNLTAMCILSGRRHSVMRAMRECRTLEEVQSLLTAPPTVAEIYETFNGPRG